MSAIQRSKDRVGAAERLLAGDICGSVSAGSNSLTEGPVLRGILRLSVPLLAVAVLQNALSLVDLFWVGRLGPSAVAAVAVAGTVLMLVHPFLMGLTTGTVALVSRSMGACNSQEAKLAAEHSLWLALILGIASAVLGWLLAGPTVGMMGIADCARRDSIAYLRISFLGSFASYLLITGNAILQGCGNAHVPFRLMLLANVVNLILDPLLIFGVGWLPRLGVSGAALASVISQALASGLCLVVLNKGLGEELAIKPWIRRPEFRMIQRILRVGLPGSGQLLSRSLMSIVLMSIVGSFGTPAVAAYGIGFRFHQLVLFPAFALGAAAATMMGQNLGAGRPERARRAVWTATGLDMLIMVVWAIIFVSFAPHLIRLFTTDTVVIEIGARYLRIISPYYIMTALGIVLGRGLNGAGDTLGPMVITLLCLWGLQVPAALWLPRLIVPPTDGIWWAHAIATAAQGTAMLVWFERGHWKHKKV